MKDPYCESCHAINVKIIQKALNLNNRIEDERTKVSAARYVIFRDQLVRSFCEECYQRILKAATSMKYEGNMKEITKAKYLKLKAFA